MFNLIKKRILQENNYHALDHNNYKYSRIVAMIYVTLLSASTILAYRIVKIGPILEPGSTLIYTFSFFMANVYTEVYGAKLSRKLIWESIFCEYLFALALTGVNFIPAPNYWDNTAAFNQVLDHILRFTNAGAIGYLTSAFLNIYLFNRWKYKMHGKSFWIRSLMASSLSEGVATFVAGIITFFGMIPIEKIIQVMTNALCFKLVYGFLIVWPASFLAFVLKREEKKAHVLNNKDDLTSIKINSGLNKNPQNFTEAI